MAMAWNRNVRTGGHFGRLWRRAPMSFRIGAIVLLLHLMVATTGPFWAPYSQSQMGTGIPLSGMSWAHPFGVDQLGRDVFSRVVHGSHIVILLSLSGTFLGLVIGAIVGLLSGYVRGWIDEVLQRLLEAIISIPFLVLALIAIAAAGPVARLLRLFALAATIGPSSATSCHADLQKRGNLTRPDAC